MLRLLRLLLSQLRYCAKTELTATYVENETTVITDITDITESTATSEIIEPIH